MSAIAGRRARLALLHLTGAGVPRDSEEAARWFRLSAQAGDREAQVDLANLLLKGEGEADDAVRTREWFEKAAASGDLVAAFNFGVCLAEGVGVERDDIKAAQWLRRAADGVVNAQYWYGRMLVEGRGLDANPEEGRTWIQRAADVGMVEAEVMLGDLLISGRGGPKDHVGALVLFEKAAGRGHAGAMFAMGALNGGGHDVPTDRAAAQRWFQAAAERGHAYAQMMLGRAPWRVAWLGNAMSSAAGAHVERACAGPGPARGAGQIWRQYCRRQPTHSRSKRRRSATERTRGDHPIRPIWRARRSSVVRRRRLQGRGDEARRWLRPWRCWLAPADGMVALALATACLGHDDERAAALYAKVTAKHDVREAWLGLAAARRRLGDRAGAAEALAAALRRHVVEPGFGGLADAIAQECGAPGWLGVGRTWVRSRNTSFLARNVANWRRSLALLASQSIRRPLQPLSAASALRMAHLLAGRGIRASRIPIRC